MNDDKDKRSVTSELIEKIDTILKKMDEIGGHVNNEQHSKVTSDLNGALATASTKFPKIEINRQNVFLASGYSDLDEIMVKIRPILGTHKLHISQAKKQEDGKTLLITRLWHASGQWIESVVFLIPTKNTIESYGSRLNCMKRFEVMDILGLTVSEDPFDDDGEADSDTERNASIKGSKLKSLYKPQKESYETITKDQYTELMIELDDEEDLTEEILDNLHIRSLRELPRSRFLPTINRIRKIKLSRVSKL